MLCLTDSELREKLSPNHPVDSSFDDESSPLIFNHIFDRKTKHFSNPSDHLEILEKLSLFSYSGVKLMVYGGFLTRTFLEYPSSFRDPDYDLDLTLVYTDNEISRVEAVSALVRFLEKHFSFENETVSSSSYVITGKIKRYYFLNKIQILNFPFNLIEKLLKSNDLSINTLCYDVQEKVYHLSLDCLNSLRTGKVKLNFSYKSVGQMTPFRMAKYLARGFAFLLPGLDMNKLPEFFDLHPLIGLSGLRGREILVLTKENKFKDYKEFNYFQSYDPKDANSLGFFLPLLEKDFYGSSYLPLSKRNDRSHLQKWNYPFGFGTRSKTVDFGVRSGPEPTQRKLKEFGKSILYHDYDVEHFYTQVWATKEEEGQGLKYLDYLVRSDDYWDCPEKGEERELILKKGDFEIRFQDRPGLIFDLKLKVFFRGKSLEIIDRYKVNHHHTVLFVNGNKCFVYSIRYLFLNSFFLRHGLQLKQNVLPFEVALNPIFSDLHMYNSSLRDCIKPKDLSTFSIKESFSRWFDENPDYSYTFVLFENKSKIDRFKLEPYSRSSKIQTMDALVSGFGLSFHSAMTLAEIYYHLGCLASSLENQELILREETGVRNPWLSYIRIMMRIPYIFRQNVLNFIYLKRKRESSKGDQRYYSLIENVICDCLEIPKLNRQCYLSYRKYLIC